MQILLGMGETVIYQKYQKQRASNLFHVDSKSWGKWSETYSWILSALLHELWKLFFCWSGLKPNRYDVQNKNKKWTLGCFKCDTLSKKKDCHATTIPYMAYITHIQKNFFPRTSLEGQTTWSKMVKIDENCRGGGGSGITVPQIYVAHYATAA